MPIRLQTDNHKILNQIPYSNNIKFAPHFLNIMNNFILFCQTSADFPYLLKEYDELVSTNPESTIKIICLNNPIYATFFKSLNLQHAKIEFLDNLLFPLKKIWVIPWWRRKAKRRLEKVIPLNNNTYYFTSIYDDPSTNFYIHLLYKKKQKIVYLNHYDKIQNIQPLGKRSLKNYFIEFLYFLFTSIRYKYYDMSGRWNPIRFPIEDYNKIIETNPTLDKHTCEKYSCQIETSDNAKKNVLLFSQPNRDQKLISDEEYNQLHLNLVNILKQNGFKVYTKGHPRIGICPVLNNEVDGVIPQYIPGELLGLSSFSACIGFLTIALSSTAKLKIIPTYSFLPCMANNDSPVYKDALSFMNASSNYNIQYIETFEILISELTN